MYVTNAGWDATYEPEESGPDECCERDEDNYGRTRRCTCGRDAAYQEWDSDHGKFPYDAFDGCRGCDPVDHECKPYGFGIELFEDEARLAATRMFSPLRGMLCSGWMVRSIWEHEREAATTISRRRLKHSDIVWDRLCNECETHHEAVKRYKAWAKRSLTIRYRDEVR